METVATFAPSPIIPVVDERIDMPIGTPKEQQQKIVVYNELLEDIYQRKTELVTLEGWLADLKLEIEGDIEHLGLRSSGKTEEAEKRGSGITAVMAFAPSSSPPSSGTEDDFSGTSTDGAMAGLRSVVGAARKGKSRGKGKGRQEKARLNGTDLRYRKGRRLHLENGHHGGYSTDEEFEGEVFVKGMACCFRLDVEVKP